MQRRHALAKLAAMTWIDGENTGDLQRFLQKKLFEEKFPSQSILVKSHGNILAVISFLHGLATDEITEKELDYNDTNYPILITIKATKPIIL